MPMKVGDCSVHTGWTLHMSNICVGCSNESSTLFQQNKQKDRYALSVTYVDGRAEIREDAVCNNTMGYNEDRWSFQCWIHDVKPRQYFEHDLVPIVWPTKNE